ncbi:cellulose biosynthesis cyclic di-GMP-binding regulatory protein BcsB [Devosia sp. BK]|uniref:cellulose biosynthesis cyclic di-GMP-binding regulatory protein BcsB n=1 Tax=Devosia sp. BK TaxID=2871706 RepID=UPI00293AD4BA|nr:cellulose biosynthesis cyclic di-GMP-binding regulatory protein BcsB [Devosia sp. BK]MDV3253167.1 cellulose biosynthesis cyclic di-GMP-binding regulatory protein BcsB [Devosia sp. BK]
MMMRALLSSAAVIAALSPAWAQPVPFDMTPENDLVVQPAPQAVPGTPTVTPAPVAAPAAFERPILPFDSLRLTGEEDKHGIVVYLTEAQAAAPATLDFSFINALVVAPEISSLRVRINNTEISNTAIASSSAATPVSLPVPAGILQAGPNMIEFRASQRHRTDCTVDSTYQLWTEIKSTDAKLVLAGAGLAPIQQLTDLAAVGVDAQGDTALRLITANGLADAQAQSAAMRIAQQIGLSMRVPKLDISFADAPSEAPTPGVLDVAIMPAAELPAELEAARAQASAGPIAAMVPVATGAYTLVISGPNWESIARAGDALLTAAPASDDRPRLDLPYPLPMMEEGTTASMASLGVDRLEFNGRRFTTTMQFELPSDFYAYRYGELELVLEAAYSRDVLPGSEIDIYTNGQIASATPMLRTEGGLLKDTRIRIPMTNLRPGRNEATFAVNLQTRSDVACGAGWTGSAPTRFVLSNNSYFHMPDYARATTVPDLQVLTGSSWPYVEEANVPAAIGQGRDTVLSALMFATRLATASNRMINFTIIPEADLSPEQDAVLIMPTGAVSQTNIGRTGVAAAGQPGAQGGDDSLLDQFAGGETSSPLTNVESWLREHLGVDTADLRLIPPPDTPYVPGAEAVVVSQTHQPEGGVWTFLTSTSPATLRAGTERLIDTVMWREIAGRVSALAPGDNEVTSVPAEMVSIVVPEPFSPTNLRRIAANWFSGNILYFTFAIVLGAVLLMLMTSRMLTRIGRPS